MSNSTNYTPFTVGLCLLLSVSIAQAYSLNNLGAAGGWDNVEKEYPPVTYVLDRSDYITDLDLTETKVTSALNNAFNTWGSVENSSLSFAEKEDLGGNYDLTDGPAEDGFLDQNANYLYANITFGGWLDNSYFDSLDGAIDGTSDILGVTWTGRVRGPLSKKPRWFADIFFNDAWTWSLSGATDTYDIETVMLHELGHAIGLGHENVADSVMGTYYLGIERDLYQDDIEGVLALYPEKTKGGKDGGGGKPPWAGGPGGRGSITILTIADYDSIVLPLDVPEPATLLLIAPGLLFLARRYPGRK